MAGKVSRKAHHGKCCQRPERGEERGAFRHTLPDHLDTITAPHILSATFENSVTSNLEGDAMIDLACASSMKCSHILEICLLNLTDVP